MGSGKTTLGISLAAKLRMPFVDLDALIESREGCKISEIFAEVGESGFRMIEQRHLNSLKRYRRAVISTGGGTPCFFDNLEFMQRYGLTIFLDTPLPILEKRLRSQRARRPILRRFSNEELLPGIVEMLTERASFYESAQIICSMSGDFQTDLQILGGAIFDWRTRAKKEGTGSEAQRLARTSGLKINGEVLAVL